MREEILYKILSIPAILVAFTFHEYAHGIVADKLGDKTARFQGRLTLNPLVHIDPIGFILILIAGFGWAKPIRVNRGAFKNYYMDDLKVSIAGPLANLFTAIVFSIISGFYFKFTYEAYGTMISIIGMILVNVVSINVILFLFNLLPVPGFDGFSILEDLFPKVFGKIGYNLYKYQQLIFIGVVFFAWRILTVPSNYIFSLLNKLIEFIVFL